VTLLFSAEQYVAAADAYLRGIERRIAAGLNPVVESVASIFISRWDVAVAFKVPEHLRGQLGIAIAGRVYKRYQMLLKSPRWQRASNFGAHAQRLLWASTGTKDPKFPDTYYVGALAAPFTINTMPEKTLIALGEGREAAEAMSPEQPEVEDVITEFEDAGIDVAKLGAELQDEGAKSFVKSWGELMDVITAKSTQLAQVG
jgi:transaldolase